ncbi:MAG: hypothetical protein K2Y32_01335 [Candidatus Obscuribacterales bacterium]|nr:hypothetical protein [Candidatus Obscuribacterales bacterium]
MTDLAAAGGQGQQKETFEIFTGNEVVASKRVKPQVTDKEKALLEKFGTAPPQSPKTERARDSASDQARQAMAADLENAGLELLGALGQNLTLLDLDQERKRYALVQAVREVVADRRVEGTIATVAALLAGYYRNSRERVEEDDFDWYDENDLLSFGYFAADRFSIFESKKQAAALLPESPEYKDWCAGFAPSENFLLALRGCARDGVIELSQLIKPCKTSNKTSNQVSQSSTFQITFGGALAPITIEEASQGELVYGAAHYGFSYLTLLEKAYGHYLTTATAKEARPILTQDGAWQAHSISKAHLPLRLLSGKAPLLVSRTESHRELDLDSFKSRATAMLREARSCEQTVYAVKQASRFKKSTRLAAALKHIALEFDETETPWLVQFDHLGKLERKPLNLEELFKDALLFYSLSSTG